MPWSCIERPDVMPRAKGFGSIMVWMSGRSDTAMAWVGGFLGGTRRS